MALPFLSNQTLAEGALVMRHRHGTAVKAHLQAVVLLPRQAIAAGIAGAARRYGDTITDSEAGNALAQCLYRTRDLMTEDQRLAQTDRTEAPMVVIMQVRSANSASLDSNVDLPWTDVFDGALLNS